MIARYATRVNGLTDIALTKLDVLSEFDTIKVCVSHGLFLKPEYMLDKATCLGFFPIV